MQDKLITVFGGSGFIGRYAVRALCKAGWRVRVAVRNPMNAGDMRLSGEVGQVQIMQANVRNRPSVARAVDGADAVLNLVGILFERGRQNFGGAQALGAANVAELAREAGVKQMVQLSAIGADADSDSEYARTKAEGEANVLEHMPNAVILRPSLVFGPEDGFFNKFGNLGRRTPVLPLIGEKTQFQPVFVGDVADAIVGALDRPDAAGRVFELGGPKTYSMREMMEFIGRETDRKPLLLPVFFPIASVMGLANSIFCWVWPFHSPVVTGDQVKLLKKDNVVGASGDAAFGTLADLGVTQLETVEAIAPTYLWRYRPYGQFQVRDNAEAISRVDV